MQRAYARRLYRLESNSSRLRLLGGGADVSNNREEQRRDLKDKAVVPGPRSVSHLRDTVLPPAPESYRLNMISTKHGAVKRRQSLRRKG